MKLKCVVAWIAVAFFSCGAAFSGGPHFHEVPANSELPQQENHNFIQFNPDYTFHLASDTPEINRQQLYILQEREEGALSDRSLYLGVAGIVLLDYQGSNRADKFGYFMRHPTDINQLGKTVTEAVVHSIQIPVTANIMPWLTAYTVLVYGPQQSFGEGNNVALTRNLVEVTRAFFMFGDLCRLPLYLTIGKMRTPFGSGRTLSPFSLSTTVHIFSGVSYGALLGALYKGFNISLMAAQGGAQFRGINSGHNATNRLDNVIIDANYVRDFTPALSVMVGGSFENGSAFCQDWPIMHFKGCNGFNNPAWAAYLDVMYHDFELLGEFNSTTKSVPGTHNPFGALSRFPAHLVSAFNVGIKYHFPWVIADCVRHWTASVEFGQVTTGPKESPWRRQGQLVAGIQTHWNSHVKFFTEYVRVIGFTPFQFLTGGIPGQSPQFLLSDSSARSNVFLLGAQAAL